MGAAVAAGFHVPYSVRSCAFGKGLFAEADVPAGALIWKNRSMPYVEAVAAVAADGLEGLTVEAVAARAGCNVLSFASEAEVRARLRELELDGASSAAQTYWLDHAYIFAGQFYEVLDDDKLCNHSEAPCAGPPPAGEAQGYCFESVYALRDIKAGEELLEDYGLYDYPPWYDALNAEFGVDLSYVVRKAAPAKGYGAAC